MLLANLRRAVQSRATADDRLKSFITLVAGLIGYDLTHLTRKVYWADCRRRIDALLPQNLDVLEVSAGATWRDIGFRSYRSLDFPEHDICGASIDPAAIGLFDLVIADQVFEHLLWPHRAGCNVFRLLRPGGHFLVMTPFPHPRPRSAARLLALDRDGDAVFPGGMRLSAGDHRNGFMGQRERAESLAGDMGPCGVAQAADQ